MTEYDAAAARHYSAYRPPLHESVVAAALGGRRFGAGLDVGCGTGRSAVALTAVADRVLGVDASADMLAAATPHARVSYRLGDAAALPVGDGSVDVVSAAGVASSIDRDLFARELRRACAPGAIILVYDFSIKMEPLLLQLGLTPPASQPGYDHQASLSGAPRIDDLAREAGRESVECSAQEAAHLVLASRTARRLLGLRGAAVAKAAKIEAAAAARLAAGAPRYRLEAAIWWSAHQVRAL